MEQSGLELAALIQRWISQAEPGDYIAINAYLPRNVQMFEQLQQLRRRILETTHCATTLGFGPRFLHSTGQLHKGGPNRALFIQITREPETDLDIPGQSLRFGTLERAQAMGDFEALKSRRRRVLYLHFKTPVLEGLL
jgi:transaldolase/glucose-6-phosphate isomerase